MEHRDTEGDLVFDVLVRDAAKQVPARRKSLFSDEPAEELPIFATLRNSLAVDGWTIKEGSLLPTTPLSLQDQRSRLRQNLADPMFNEAPTCAIASRSTGFGMQHTPHRAIPPNGHHHSRHDRLHALIHILDVPSSWAAVRHVADKIVQVVAGKLQLIDDLTSAEARAPNADLRIEAENSAGLDVSAITWWNSTEPASMISSHSRTTLRVLAMIGSVWEVSKPSLISLSAISGMSDVI